MNPAPDGANFWIRGISTFGANKSPLLILDGVEIVSEMLNNIPPEAIESFSILRDATATALYGSRGANGVMIITTKNGRQSEKMAINVRLESGISMPTRVQDIADGVTYMENYNEALRTQAPRRAKLMCSTFRTRRSRAPATGSIPTSIPTMTGIRCFSRILRSTRT